MAVVLPMVLVMVVVMVVIVMVVMMVVMMGIVMAVMVTDAVVSAKALTQGQLGRQLSDGLSLVQNCLFLPHKTFAQVQDGCFGLVRHRATPIAAIWAITVTICGWSMGHTGRRIAARVCLWWNWSANKFGADAIIIFYARQTTCCCCT